MIRFSLHCAPWSNANTDVLEANGIVPPASEKRKAVDEPNDEPLNADEPTESLAAAKIEKSEVYVCC